MAPNWGVREIQARVRFARRRQEPLSGLENVLEEGGRGSGIPGDGLKRRARFAS
jgi:hypothetical protein